MTDQIRITVEHLIDGVANTKTVVVNKAVEKVVSIAELGFNHQQQIDLIKGCQNALLKIQSKHLQSDLEFCPKCNTKLKLAGQTKSLFSQYLLIKKFLLNVKSVVIKIVAGQMCQV